MAPNDKRILLKLAEVEERTPSDVVRRLIRQAAAARGLATNGIEGQVAQVPQPCAAQSG